MNPLSRSIVILSAVLLLARGGLADPSDSDSASLNTTDSGVVPPSNDTITAPSNETIDGGDSSTPPVNNSDPTSPSSAFSNATHLFTLKLELGPPLSSTKNASQSGFRTVRAILGGTIAGRELNASVLGGVAYPNSHSPSDPAPSSGVASASLWGLTSTNQSVFITQTRLGPVDTERLGRLTVEFEAGDRLSESLLLSWPTKNFNVSYTEDTNAVLSFDAWGII